MPDPEKQQLLNALRDGRAALGTALAGLDERLAACKPADGGWSILECMEHVAKVEEFLLGRLRAATEIAQPQVNPKREAKIAAYAADRKRKIEAPPLSHAHGRFATVREALTAFDAARAGVMGYLEPFEGDLRCWVTDHPLVPGPVTCYEMLVMIAAHPKRHGEQIEEIRKGLGNAKVAH
jgi:DinB superfamily